MSVHRPTNLPVILIDVFQFYSVVQHEYRDSVSIEALVAIYFISFAGRVMPRNFGTYAV